MSLYSFNLVWVSISNLCKGKSIISFLLVLVLYFSYIRLGETIFAEKA